MQFGDLQSTFQRLSLETSSYNNFVFFFCKFYVNISLRIKLILTGRRMSWNFRSLEIAERGGMKKKQKKFPRSRWKLHTKNTPNHISETFIVFN